MKEPRQVTVTCSGHACTVQGFPNPKPYIDAFVKTVQHAEIKGKQFTPQLLARVIATRVAPGIKVSGTAKRVVISRADIRRHVLRPKEVAEQRMSEAQRIIDETRKSAGTPEPDPFLFNPLARLAPLGHVKGTRPALDLAALDAFEWRGFGEEPMPASAPPMLKPEAEQPSGEADNSNEAPSSVEPTTAVQDQSSRHQVFDFDMENVSPALETAMSGETSDDEFEPDLPILKLSDYAAPRRPRTLEQALEITAAYRHFIMGERVFARRDVLLDVDEIALDDGPFPADVKLRTFQILVDHGRLIQRDRGVFILAKSLLLRFGR